MSQNKNSSGGFHYAWVILIIATVVLGVYAPVVNSLSNSWQIPVTEDLGFSRTAFSVTGTITQAVGIFAGPIVSRILSKGNFKRIWTVAAIAFSLGLVGYAFAQNQYHFYIAGFVVGLSYIATTSIPMTMMINNWFIEKRGLATSIAVSGISAGGAILSPLISGVINNAGWRQAYMLYAIIVLVIALVSGIFLIRLKPEDVGLKPYGYQAKASATEPGEVEETDADQGEDDKLNVALPVTFSLTAAFFIFLIIGSVFNGLSNGGSLQFRPALEEASDAATASSAVSLYLILGVFGKLFLGWVSDRFGLVKALIVGTGSLMLSFVAMLFADQPWGPWLVAIIFGLGLAMGTVLPPLVTGAIYNREYYGEAYGYVQSAVQIGMAIGPLIVPAVFDTTGSYDGAWYIMIVFALLTGVFWWLAYRSAKKYSSNTKEGRENTEERLREKMN